MDTLEVVKIALNPTGYIIEKIVNRNVVEFSEGSEKSSLQELKEHALREEIKSSVLQNQAKVEQELAIARRIENAEEVEIEEYYDLSGNGGVGLKGDDKGVTVGVNGEGRKVTKRVIKFRGYNSIVRTISEGEQA